MCCHLFGLKFIMIKCKTLSPCSRLLAKLIGQRCTAMLTSVKNMANKACAQRLQR
jgi:hypothetical protein